MKFIFLSDNFYEDYKNCPEIEAKKTRPYAKVIVQIGSYTFAVPLRSHIEHPHVLYTDKENLCGLDFSKTVIVTTDRYIRQDKHPHIRQNEFDALRGKEYIVKQKLLSYIKKYTKAKEHPEIGRNKTLLRYSTLQYFEKELSAFLGECFKE